MKVSLSKSLQIQKRNHIAIGKQLLEKTSFHALPWLLENVSWLSKACVVIYFLVSFTVAFQLTGSSVMIDTSNINRNHAQTQNIQHLLSIILHLRSTTLSWTGHRRCPLAK